METDLIGARVEVGVIMQKPVDGDCWHVTSEGTVVAVAMSYEKNGRMVFNVLVMDDDGWLHPHPHDRVHVIAEPEDPEPPDVPFLMRPGEHKRGVEVRSA